MRLTSCRPLRQERGDLPLDCAPSACLATGGLRQWNRRRIKDKSYRITWIHELKCSWSRGRGRVRGRYARMSGLEAAGGLVSLCCGRSRSCGFCVGRTSNVTAPACRTRTSDFDFAACRPRSRRTAPASSIRRKGEHDRWELVAWSQRRGCSGDERADEYRPCRDGAPTASARNLRRTGEAARLLTHQM
jgi:hypothetical protein